MASLALSVREIQISVNALNIQLSDLEAYESLRLKENTKQQL
jgi:hypothetical protein